ncbi:MAG: hypothetical protein AAB969_02105, partial [Patescibacteria group bacterium]
GILLKIIFVLNGQIVWPLVVILIINFLYFLFIFLKKSKGEIFIFLLHSSILVLTGFSYILILNGELFINLFLVVWVLLYFLYLESIFHHFYETKKVLLLDLKNIIAYINLIALFFLSASLINFYIFINFSIWLIFVLIALIVFLLAISQLRVNNILGKKSLVYSLILSLIIIEVLSAVLFLSVSFYVSAIMLTVLYYLLSSLLVLNAKGNLTKNIVWQYIGFSLIVIFIIAITSQWL